MSERDEKICNNIGLVHTCARRFIGRGIEYDDLYQAGSMGLVKAVDGFDESRGLKFSTYAVPVILGEIRRLFRDGGTVKVSRSLKELAMRVSRERDAFCLREGREPSVTELADALGIEREQAAEALGASLPALSLTRSGEEDDGDEVDIPVASPEEIITDRLALRQLLAELSPHDRTLIEYRYFKRQTQQVTAEKLGMTQVQVSRRERAILRQLREQLIG
ncbi:MAG: sigma-70 family RNA polymerase sigma factor [Clostridia bacterium]|nr:sigma-70 family RNA polymerase sigma factor [Clostridia bacterium]